MNKSKLILAAVFVVAIAGFFYFDLGSYFSLDYFSTQKDNIDQFYQNNQLLTMAIYFLVYIAVTGLSLPGAAILTLVGGAIFGLFYGLLLISFASSIGATLAFLFSRFLLKDWVQNSYAKQLKAINEGIEKEGTFYLFMLRMVPVFPFFIINLVMGLTPLKTAQFYLTSQLGMLLGTAAYVYAGTQLATISSPSDIITPGIISAFVALGLLPIVAKKLVEYLRKNKAENSTS